MIFAKIRTVLFYSLLAAALSLIMIIPLPYALLVSFMASLAVYFSSVAAREVKRIVPVSEDGPYWTAEMRSLASDILWDERTLDIERETFERVFPKGIVESYNDDIVDLLQKQDPQVTPKMFKAEPDRIYDLLKKEMKDRADLSYAVGQNPALPDVPAGPNMSKRRREAA